MAALIDKWRRLGHELGFGIGIAHGYATLGTIGFEGRFDYAAIGTVSNVASRLCDEAAPGQILISPRVLLAIEKDVAVEPAGEFELKGIRRPMAVHNVIGQTEPSGLTLQLQIPILRHHVLAPAFVRLAARQREAGLLIDVARGGEDAVRPQRDLLVAGLAREADAFLGQPWRRAPGRALSDRPAAGGCGRRRGNPSPA